MSEGNRKIDPRVEGEKAKEELREKSLELAFEIVSEIEAETNSKITFQQFDSIFKKVHRAANEGFLSGMFIMLEGCTSVISNRYSTKK